MPCSRIGRSTSTTPWSKSISITRSATMHSRPIETCWKAEIVHSWPSTVFAPISHLALVRADLRAVADPRPAPEVQPRVAGRSRASRPGRRSARPSVCRRPRKRSFSHARRSEQARVAPGEHPVRAQEAQQRERPAVARGRARRGRAGGSAADARPGGEDRCPRDARCSLRAAMAGRLARPSGSWPATSARSPARSRSSSTTIPAGWELVREVYPHTGKAAIVGLTGRARRRASRRSSAR